MRQGKILIKHSEASSIRLCYISLYTRLQRYFPGMSSNDLINIQESGYFGQIPIKQAFPLSLHSGCWPYLRSLHHLNVQHGHMLPYSTLYVAIVTLQCFSGICFQQDAWCKCAPCKVNEHQKRQYSASEQDQCPQIHRNL